MSSRWYYIFFALLLGGCFKTAPAEVNLALGKRYTISPKPNYSLCTDELDTVQLTDGKTYGSSWTKKSTVGWRIKDSIPEITIDLGSVLPIGELRVHSVGGGRAAVEFPEFLAALVSNDNKVFRFAGLADSLALAGGTQKKISHAFAVKNLRTEGRFVKIVMQPGGVHLFLDEIEVLSSMEQKARARESPAVGSSQELLGTVEEVLRLKAMTAATTRFVDEHRKLLSSDFAQKTYRDLAAITGKLSEPADIAFSADRSALVEGDLGAVRAKIYKEIYRKPYTCLPADPMEVLFQEQMVFTTEADNGEIALRLWRGEYESAAVNVINCSTASIRMAVSVSPLLGAEGKVVESTDVFTIRRAVFVKARKMGSIGDALVPQDDSPFTLMPGETGQIWLTIHSPKLMAGSYRAALAFFAALSDGSKLPDTVMPIRIQIDPINFPKDTSLNVCNWAYPRLSGVTREVLSETAKDLSSHYTNVFVVHHKNLPFPTRISAEGRIIAALPYENADSLLRANSFAKTFLFFYGFESQRKDSGRFGKWMSYEWKKAFTLWLTDWVDHLRQTGIDYDRFAMYPFDESLCNEFYELAKLIKSIDSKIRIYANSFGKGPRDFMRFKDIVDIWCLRDSYCARHPDWLRTIKGFGKEVWLYECHGPGKANHPYSYYRLMPWRAFKRGLTGVGFWSYTTHRDIVPWDDTGTAIGYYGVVYGAAESSRTSAGKTIIPSRRWEAWREGIEDYVYLSELKKAINRMKTRDPSKANQLLRFIDEQTDKVLASPDNSEVVYKVRQGLSTALIQAPGAK